MRGPGQLARLIYINYVMARHGMDKVVLNTPWLSSFRFLSYLNPWNWFGPKLSRGERIRLILEDLGPMFVKFGQILSTRSDLLPKDILVELIKLQDSVPPFPSNQAKQIIEKAYQKPLADMFFQFELQPLASASIAQVHAAELIDGRQVVVKILRPNIEKTIRRDLALMYSAAKLARHFLTGTGQDKPMQIVAEFERTIMSELDLTREAANASQLRRNFADSDKLYVPEIYWPYVRKNVMVMERIRGVQVADIDKLLALNVDLKKLAEDGLEIFFTQVFRDSFFHADMHPGNLFVDVTDPNNPSYIAVDFGIMGSLSPTDQAYIGENMLAFFQRDYRKVATLHLESGWLPADVRLEEFEFAIRSVCEPIFERPLRDISFGQLLVNLFQTAAHFRVRLQPQLLLLQKTLLNVEGLGRQLYPELDLWATAKPFLERWLREKYGPKAILKQMVERAPQWARKLVDMPDLVYERLRREEKQLIIQAPKKKSRRGFLLGFGFGLILIGALNVWVNHFAPSPFVNFSWMVAGIGLLSMCFGVVLSRK